MNNLTQRAAEIIKTIKYITIASVTSDGKPWNSPVYSAYDGELDFYWFSDKESQHSTNIRANGEVFIVIYDSTVPEGTGEGVYLQCKAVEITDANETLDALRILDARIGKTKERTIEKYSGDAPLRGYKATPIKIWMNDDALDKNGDWLKDIRTELRQAELLSLL